VNAAATPRLETCSQRGSMLAVLAVCLGLAILVIVLSFRVHSLKTQVATKGADTHQQAAPAKPDNTQALADLDKAKGALAQLQLKLDQATSRQGDLQSDLAKARARSADLQSQLDGARASSAELQSQLDKAKSQSADLEGRLDQAASKSSQLLSQLDQERGRSADLQSRLKKAEGEIAGLQPLVHRARRMPVATSVERAQGSLFGLASSKVSFTLHISNLSLEPLSVAITVTGPEATRSVSGTIAGRTTLDIEKLAGGENVAIASESYDPVSVTVQ